MIYYSSSCFFFFVVTKFQAQVEREEVANGFSHFNFTRLCGFVPLSRNSLNWDRADVIARAASRNVIISLILPRKLL